MKSKSSHFKLKITLFTIILILVVISVFRVPVVGVSIDSVLFEFMFGYCKYLVYFCLILLCYISMFSVKHIYWISKRKLLCYGLVVFVLCLILASIYNLVFIKSQYSFSEFYINKEYSYISVWYDKNLKNICTDLFRINPYCFGGLIGIFVVSLIDCYSIIMLSIILFLFLILLLYIIFKYQATSSIKKRIIKKLGGYTSQNINIVSENSNSIYFLINTLLNNYHQHILKTEFDFNNFTITIFINSSNQINSIKDQINNKFTQLQQLYSLKDTYQIFIQETK